MSRAAIRYAKAVLSLAKDQNKMLDVQTDMKRISDTIEASGELRMVLQSPLIKSEVKLASLKEIFKNSQDITQNLFEILIRNKRIEILDKVAINYQQLYDKMHNIQVAKVTTAIPLDASLGMKVKAKVKELTGNEAVLENIVDESIIGGFILRVGDLQYNASIKNKLTTLRRELSN
ncbi:ATP synthase F1 subunit delta [Aquimarina sp. ERC-38]|uniref:ATP synthase F1 subunit delta n=1 Tax=Aquimarina sp. ERC-38 TaxID=2949996 RepID=UPI0022454044|nr:ATP synthase F1 subunit delta [Aquimarina sp. ERC-38]UZO81669.1 ATP synthase F1 subunit delta [Aquimarina sp. ERC-38]